MKNFTYRNPTKLIFGEGMIAKIAKEIPAGAKIMITYGGGSIFRNGVYDQVKQALDGRDTVEFGGIEANPEYETLLKAVDQCRREKVDFLLAVGGGSVIDGTKFIAAALKFDGDPWDILLDPRNATDAMPFGTVLTLPATGSEMNSGAVVSRRERNEKLPFHNPNGFPKFSVLDPTACYSLPPKQVVNGILDTYIHTMEQYLTCDNKAMVMDRWAEGILLTLIELAPKLMERHDDYDTMANFMIAATVALNGYIEWGVAQDWATHMIGHELTALHGLDHGMTLAIVYPGTMRVMRPEKREKLIRYAEKVWGLTGGSDDEKIDGAIARTEEFFRSLGLKIRLGDYGIGQETIDEVVRRFKTRGWNVGEGGIVTPEKAGKILESVL